MAYFGESEWKQISRHVGGRSPIQCLHRWTKKLKPGLVQGSWTSEEDEKLRAWVKENGAAGWGECSKEAIPGRSGKQCRERWMNALCPKLKKGGWTSAEDELIFQLYRQLGSSWSKIAKSVPGRTENSVKNRFYSTLRKIVRAKKLVDPANTSLSVVEKARILKREKASSALFRILLESAELTKLMKGKSVKS